MEDPATPAPAAEPERAAPGTVWESGDPRKASAALGYVAERLLEALELRFGTRVLDVGSGTGNAALAAARRGAQAVALDPSRLALQHSAARAWAEGIRVRRVLGVAESMPFKPASFDLAVSTFGVMFTNDPDAAAEELIRVTRPGGTLALASWTPSGFLGEVYKLVDPYGEGAVLPTIWGSRERMLAWFGRRSEELSTATRTVRLRGPTVERYVDYLTTTFGPVLDAMAERDPDGQAALKTQLLDLAHRFNRSEDPSALITSEYLEVIVRLR